MDKPLHAYLNAVADLTRRGDAREESYYPALTTLLETLAQTQNRAVKVTVLPKPTEAGNPDFRMMERYRSALEEFICCHRRTNGGDLDWSMLTPVEFKDYTAYLQSVWGMSLASVNLRLGGDPLAAQTPGAFPAGQAAKSRSPRRSKPSRPVK